MDKGMRFAVDFIEAIAINPNLRPSTTRGA